MPDARKKPFSLGVNFPWRNYGQDFGCINGAHIGISAAAVHNDLGKELARIRDTGVSVVRWFAFGDGRGGFVAHRGIAKRPDEMLFADVAAVLELARRQNLELCLSLIDYLWLQEHGGKRAAHAHEHVLHFTGGREAFLQNVLIPLFREFRGHEAVFAWEIANEPEWAIREFHPVREAKLRFADFRAYANGIARAVHEFGKAAVTLGSARLRWVRAWSGIGLDLYQAHHYPGGEAETRRGLAQQLSSLPRWDRPLWLGELPARDLALGVCRKAGLSGAAVWRWTEPEAQGSDVALGRVEPAILREWSEAEHREGQSG